MSLPDFNTEGLLPDGVHPSTEDELKERCVDPFTTSRTRQPVFDGFCLYRNALNSLGLNITQWVDGSFVDESRIDPDDIDLVNFVGADELNAIPVADRPRVAALLDGRDTTKVAYSCHTFLEVAFPPGHPFALIQEQRRREWRHCWAMPQDYSRPPIKTPAPYRGRKGFLSMVVGNSSLAPTISTNL
jgi:hypothetical protein